MTPLPLYLRENSIKYLKPGPDISISQTLVGFHFETVPAFELDLPRLMLLDISIHLLVLS